MYLCRSRASRPVYTPIYTVLKKVSVQQELKSLFLLGILSIVKSCGKDVVVYYASNAVLQLNITLYGRNTKKEKTTSDHGSVLPFSFFKYIN